MKKYLILLLLLPVLGFGQKNLKLSTPRIDTIIFTKGSHDSIWQAHITADSEFYFNGKHYSLKAHGGGGSSDTTSHIKSWQHELSSDAQNNFALPFNLATTSVVECNGFSIPNSLWSGVGTSTLDVSISILKYSHLTIIK
jgi:hypothetical protein